MCNDKVNKYLKAYVGVPKHATFIYYNYIKLSYQYHIKVYNNSL